MEERQENVPTGRSRKLAGGAGTVLLKQYWLAERRQAALGLLPDETVQRSEAGLQGDHYAVNFRRERNTTTAAG